MLCVVLRITYEGYLSQYSRTGIFRQFCNKIDIFVTEREYLLWFNQVCCIMFPYGNFINMKYNAQSIGQIVRDTRKAMNITQKSLAMTSGTGLRFIIDLEKGKPSCQLEKVLIVLNTLGIQLSLVSPYLQKVDG